MKVLAIIPARGGSKSIIDKNIAIVGGKPLLAWTIEAAKAAKSIDRIVLSTDSEKIAEIGINYGAEIPFLRPPELAQDDTPGIDPILHAIMWLEKNEEYRPDHVLCLQPTSPLRNEEDIESALNILIDKRADAVVSLCVPEHHPYWMKKVDSNGLMSNFSQTEVPYRRQDLPAVYALNGAIYLARRELLQGKRSWYAGKTCAYIMPPERSLDIDSAWDLYLADLILKGRQ